jgi:hypothetical protein
MNQAKMNQDLEERIFRFVSVHEGQLSHDLEKQGLENIKFTRFGTRAGCRALHEVIEILNEDQKLKVLEMMKNRKISS